MANEERIEAWQASVTRCGLAARALNATIALYHSAGQDVDAAWEAVTAARKAFALATTREAHSWKLASGQDAQPAIPGLESGRRRGRPRSAPAEPH
jgi:hypothetical protein